MDIGDSLRGFWISLIAASLAAYPIYRLLLKMRSRQTVSPYAPQTHQAKEGTPTMGGLIVVSGVLAALIVQYFSPTSQRIESTGLDPKVELRMVLASLALTIGFAAIGFIDDFIMPKVRGIRGLEWKSKLVMQVFVATAAIGVASSSLDGVHLFLGVFTVLFMSNAYNFADGLDGLAGSLGIILTLGFIALCGVYGHPLWTATILAGTVAGGLIPFLIFNAPPARVFMGDVGSLPLGALFGFMYWELIQGWESPSQGVADWRIILPLIVLNLVLIAELLPVPIQIAWVKLFKKRLFPYTPIHHAFEKAGWPESRVVWTFGVFQAVLAAASASFAWFVWPARGHH